MIDTILLALILSFLVITRWYDWRKANTWTLPKGTSRVFVTGVGGGGGGGGSVKIKVD